MTDRVDMDAIYRQYKRDIMLPPIEVTPEEEPSAYEKAILQPLAATTKESPEAYGEAVPDILSGTAKGAISGVAGLPGELGGLVSGILNSVMPYDYNGKEQDPNKSMGERFAEGYDAVPGKIEDVREGLTAAGWKTDELGGLFESIAEFVAPFGATKNTAKGAINVVKNIKGKK